MHKHIYYTYCRDICVPAWMNLKCAGGQVRQSSREDATTLDLTAKCVCFHRWGGKEMEQNNNLVPAIL